MTSLNSQIGDKMRKTADKFGEKSSRFRENLPQK